MKEIKTGIEIPRYISEKTSSTNRQKTSQNTSHRTSNNSSRLERTPKQDRFESSSRTKKAQPKKQSILRKPAVISGLTCFLAGAITAGTLGKTIIKTKPEQFDYIQEQIENSSDPYEIEALKNKQEAQQEIAKGFVDGDFVYYVIGSDDDPYIYIDAEEFKDLFDIEDGELKKYNRLSTSYMDTPRDPDGHSGIFTYDTHNFKNGDIVKVPLSAIETDDIDLDGYYEGLNFALD